MHTCFESAFSRHSGRISEDLSSYLPRVPPIPGQEVPMLTIPLSIENSYHWTNTFTSGTSTTLSTIVWSQFRNGEARSVRKQLSMACPYVRFGVFRLPTVRTTSTIHCRLCNCNTIQCNLRSAIRKTPESYPANGSVGIDSLADTACAGADVDESWGLGGFGE